MTSSPHCSRPGDSGLAEPPLSSPAEPSAVEQQQRRELREHLLAQRRSLSADTVEINSRRIAERLLPLLAQSRAIAGYLAMGREVNVERVLQACRERGSRCHVPLVLADHSLLFAPLDDDTPIRRNRYGIREPEVDPEQCVLPQQLDTVLVPLLGFDRLGNRMGMGGGYYDRTFAYLRHAGKDSSRQRTSQTTTPIQLIGVAHELQCLDKLPAAWWDVPLSMVVTESRIHCFATPDNS